MSAMTISNVEVNTLLSAAIDAGLSLPGRDGRPARVTRENAYSFGKLLKAENAEALLNLYGHRMADDEWSQLVEGIDGYSFIYIAGVKPEALARLAQFVEFQARDHAHYDRTQTSAVISAVSIWSDAKKLSGRDIAALPWGIRAANDCLAMLNPVFPLEDIARRHPVITTLFVIAFAAAFAGVIASA